MKLDLAEIQKHSPPGLCGLQVLAAFITCLVQVMNSGVGTRLIYGRMVLTFSRELREKVQDNLNMRIKAWVMCCPERTLWVRQIIGETAIRKWRTNRLLDYALTEYFGDWRVKFSGGFSGRVEAVGSKSSHIIIRKIRAYTWKPFALVKITNVERILFGHQISKTVMGSETEDLCAAYSKLWDVDITGKNDTPEWQQPRTPRTQKPVEFKPDELEVKGYEEAAANMNEKENTSVMQIALNPLEKAKLKSKSDVAKKMIEKPP